MIFIMESLQTIIDIDLKPLYLIIISSPSLYCLRLRVGFPFSGGGHLC